jgi:hypothetical protein
MKHPTALLIAAVAFAGLSAAARAQQADSSCGAFFATPGPALIFQVSDLTPYSYEGGIGVGYVFSPRVFGRLSITIGARSSKTEDQNLHGSTNVTNEWSLGCGLAPAHVLYHERPLSLYCGPMLRGGLGYGKQTYEYADSVFTSVAWNKTTSWSIGAGAFVGVGFTVMQRLFLAFEYRLEETYTTSTSTSGKNIRGYVGSERDSQSWRTENRALFLLSCRF